MLNFNDDQTVEQYLSQLEARLTYQGQLGRLDGLKETLAQVGTVVEAELMALGSSLWMIP